MERRILLTSSLGTLRNAACAYADVGWKVFPLAPRRKYPAGRLVPHGQNEATSDLVTVFQWWAQEPQANIAVNCGRSGIVALDIDPRNGGDDSLYDLLRQLGPLPATVEAFSGGGGQHMLFKDYGYTYRKELAPGVDVKANGYIVLPPSIHPSGGEYVWSVDGDPAELSPAVLPPAWLDRVSVSARANTPSLGSTSDALKLIPARTYVEVLTGRSADERGWVQCPLHKGGRERTPSLYVRGRLWACYGCEPQGGKRALGGNIFDLAAVLWGYQLPLGSADYGRVRRRVEGVFGERSPS